MSISEFSTELADHLECADIVKSAKPLKDDTFIVTTIYGHDFLMKRHPVGIYDMMFVLKYEHSDKTYLPLILRDISYTLRNQIYYGKVENNEVVKYRRNRDNFRDYNVIVAIPNTKNATLIKRALYAKWWFNELKNINTITK
jgi:hypothetical protein